MHVDEYRAAFEPPTREEALRIELASLTHRAAQIRAELLILERDRVREDARKRGWSNDDAD